MAAAALAACDSAPSGDQPAACEAPSGCVRADRVAGACECLEWQLVSIEPVPVRFLVVGIIYPPLGDQSSVAYGYTDSSFVLPPGLTASSDLGARWRAVVRSADGSESAAPLGPITTGPGDWGPVVGVTEASAVMALPTSAAMWWAQSDADVQSHDSDLFLIWINPAAMVATDYAGNKSVIWSWRSDCSYPAGCGGPYVFTFSAEQLSGKVIPIDPYVKAMIDAFDQADRSTILAYDPFYAGAATTATLGADPRFKALGTASLNPYQAIAPPTSWLPCASSLTDDTFLPLAETEVPFGQRETLVIQHGVLSTSVACKQQLPGVLVGSTSPTCFFDAQTFVDTMFGTLLMVPSTLSEGCTRN